MPEKRKRKGLVMETLPEEIIVLTPVGEFIKIVWRNEPLPEVGSEITFEDSITAFQRFSSVKFLALAASLLLCFLSLSFLSSILFPVSSQVVAYVSIDINPSVELGLDEEGIVREATGLNEEGEDLVKTLELLEQTVEKAMQIITDEAAKKRYLAADKDNNIIVTFSAREENDQAKVSANTQVLGKLEKVLDTEVKTALQGRNIEVQVELLEVSAQIQQQAQEHGLSAGKYAVMLEAQQAGLEINVEDLRFSNVVKVIKDAGGIPGQIISKAKQDEKRLPEWANELKEREMKEKGQNDGKGTDKDNGKDKDKNKKKDKQSQEENMQNMDEKFEEIEVENRSSNKPGKNDWSSRMSPASDSKSNDSKSNDNKSNDNKSNDNKSNDNKSNEEGADEKKADEKYKEAKNRR